MATTLSYGYEKPQTGDKGSVFWPILESNIQKENDHNHNGINSPLLTAASSTVISQAISSASWSAQGGGTFRQTITLPASLTSVGGTYDDYPILFRNTSNKRQVFLQTEKVSSTTYYLFSNDDTLDVTAIYG